MQQEESGMDEDDKGRHRSQNSEPALQAAMKRKRYLNDTHHHDDDGDRPRPAALNDSKQHAKGPDGDAKRAFSTSIPRRPRTGSNHRPRKVLCTTNDWDEGGSEEEAAKVKPEEEDLDEEQMVAEALFDLANSVLPPAALPARGAGARTPLLNQIFAAAAAPSNSDTESDEAARRAPAGPAARPQRPRKPREIRKIPPRIVEERPGPPVEQLRHRKIPPRIVETRLRPPGSGGGAGSPGPGGTSSDGYEPRPPRDAPPLKPDPDHTSADPAPASGRDRDRSRSPPARARSPANGPTRGGPAAATTAAAVKSEHLFRPPADAAAGAAAHGVGPPGAGSAPLGAERLLPHHLAYAPHSGGPPLPITIKHEGGGAPLFQHLPPGPAFSTHVPLPSKHSSNFPLPPMAPISNLAAMSPTNPLFLSHLILNNHPLSRPTGKDPTAPHPPGATPPGHYPTILDPSRVPVALLAGHPPGAAPPFPPPPQSSLKSLYKRCAFHVYIAHFIQDQHQRNAAAAKDPHHPPASASTPSSAAPPTKPDPHSDDPHASKPPPASPPRTDPSHPHASRPPSGGGLTFQPPASLPWKLEADPRGGPPGTLGLKLDASGPPLALHPGPPHDAPLFAAAHPKALPTSIPQSFHTLGHIPHFGPLFLPPSSQAIAWPPRTLAASLGGPSPPGGPLHHMQIPSGIFINPSTMQPIPPSLLVNGPAVHPHPQLPTGPPGLSSPHVTAAQFFPAHLGPWLAAAPQLGSPPGAAPPHMHRPDLLKDGTRPPGRADLQGAQMLAGGPLPVDPSDPMHIKALGAQIIPRMSISSHPLSDAGAGGRPPAEVDPIKASRPPILRS